MQVEQGYPKSGAEKIVYRLLESDEEKGSFLDRGHNLNITVMALLIIPLLMLIIGLLDYKELSKDPYAIIFLTLVCTLFPFYVLWNYYNMAPEIAIDDTFLYVRKMKKFKKIPFVDIDYVLVSPSITGYTSIKLKKRKGAKKLPLTYFQIPSQIAKEKELLSSICAELEKRVRLEHNTWTRYFKKSG